MLEAMRLARLEEEKVSASRKSKSNNNKGFIVGNSTTTTTPTVGSVEHKSIKIIPLQQQPLTRN